MSCLLDLEYIMMISHTETQHSGSVVIHEIVQF